MTYLELLNTFDEWVEQNPISTCQIAIWYRRLHFITGSDGQNGFQ